MNMPQTSTERPLPPHDSFFTPVFDVIVNELGNTAANVYGVVWRHCQMHDHVCRASMRTLARALGLNESTVLRHVKALVSSDYLEDLTPNVRHRPHHYRVRDGAARPPADEAAASL
jgi:hypothetical protein